MVNVSSQLLSAFRQISKKRVMVIGDLVLDTYTVGKAKRISLEAPVPVLHVQYEEHRPGMVGNVALNLISMGGEVVVLGRVGNDVSGRNVVAKLEEEGIDPEGIVVQELFPTPVKNRVIANNQQMVRVDYEEALPLSPLLEQQIIDRLPSLLENIGVVAISDYGKGFVTPTLLKAVISLAKERNIPTIVDPKGVDFGRYSGAYVIKPNLSEVYAAANLPLEAPLDQAALRVLEMAQADLLMVTRSEEGISLFHRDGQREDFPVVSREVKDVTGAGDTVLAMLAMAVACGVSVADGARLSNVAAGIAIERFGCARVTLSDLARSLLSKGTENKVFDEEHLFALQEVLRGRDYVILSLSSKQGMEPALFEAIRTLSARKECDLLICFEDAGQASQNSKFEGDCGIEPSLDFVEVLASLRAVDYILVRSGGIKHLCSLLSPKEVYSLDKGKLVRLEI